VTILEINTRDTGDIGYRGHIVYERDIVYGRDIVYRSLFP
jgi:hypothetical protein